MEENSKQREQNEGAGPVSELMKVYDNQEKDDEDVIKCQPQRE